MLSVICFQSITIFLSFDQFVTLCSNHQNLIWLHFYQLEVSQWVQMLRACPEMAPIRGFSFQFSNFKFILWIATGSHLHFQRWNVRDGQRSSSGIATGPWGTAWVSNISSISMRLGYVTNDSIYSAHHSNRHAPGRFRNFGWHGKNGDMFRLVTSLSHRLAIAIIIWKNKIRIIKILTRFEVNYDWEYGEFKLYAQCAGREMSSVNPSNTQFDRVSSFLACWDLPPHVEVMLVQLL